MCTGRSARAPKPREPAGVAAASDIAACTLPHGAVDLSTKYRAWMASRPWSVALALLPAHPPRRDVGMGLSRFRLGFRHASTMEMARRRVRRSVWESADVYVKRTALGATCR